MISKISEAIVKEDTFQIFNSGETDILLIIKKYTEQPPLAQIKSDLNDFLTKIILSVNYDTFLYNEAFRLLKMLNKIYEDLSDDPLKFVDNQTEDLIKTYFDSVVEFTAGIEDETVRKYVKYLES